MTWGDVLYLLPEIVIALGACFLLLAPVTGFRSEGNAARWSMLVVLALTAAAVVICSNLAEDAEQPTRMFAAMFALDSFAVFFKLLFVVAAPATRPGSTTRCWPSLSAG
jgi:NADH:ubiquinone oxidoreductase subunit 2 (subunit N)